MPQQFSLDLNIHHGTGIPGRSKCSFISKKNGSKTYHVSSDKWTLDACSSPIGRFNTNPFGIGVQRCHPTHLQKPHQPHRSNGAVCAHRHTGTPEDGSISLMELSSGHLLGTLSMEELHEIMTWCDEDARRGGRWRGLLVAAFHPFWDIVLWCSFEGAEWATLTLWHCCWCCRWQ